MHWASLGLIVEILVAPRFSVLALSASESAPRSRTVMVAGRAILIYW